MDIIVRAAVMFVALYLLVRLLGRRELAQLTPFELIVLVVTGDLIQQGVTHNDFSLTGAILAVVTIAFLALVLSWATYLSPTAERLLDGPPLVIVRDGELIKANLRKDRITPTEVETEMRLAGIAHLRDVAWAVIEPRGRMSFIQRERRGGGGDEPSAQQADDAGAV
jgi:uncharacterized membrane protein YcaP (DUF421 family)